jgi:hypothetical protein
MPDPISGAIEEPAVLFPGEPADEEFEDENETGGETVAETSESEAAERTSKQSPDLDAAFAKARRAEEETARLKAELDQWKEAANAQKTIEQQAEMEKKLQEYKDAGWDPQTIRDIIRTDPEFQSIKRALEETKKAESERAHVTDFNAELSALGEEWPEFTSLQVKSSTDQAADQKIKGIVGDEVYAKMLFLKQKGYSILDAYESANRTALASKRTEKAKQATLNSIQGRSSVKSEGAATTNDLEHIQIDADEFARFKAMNPTWTDEKIMEFKAKCIAEDRKNNPRTR